VKRSSRQLTAEQDFLLTLSRGLMTVAKREVSPLDFGSWLRKYRSEFDWSYPHFVFMQEALDRMTRGEVLRLMFQVAIRHGKTEHNTIAYAAYRLWLEPRTRIIVASYNDRQAQKLSRQIRRLAISCGVVIGRGGDGEWETPEGGGVRAVGSGSGVASVNADIIVIDDPIGSRDEAESQAERDRIWDWITNDLLARCEPHTAVTFTMSRWHMDDPAGRIADRFPDLWEVVDLPGMAEEGDPLGRAPGEPLWPEMRDEKWLTTKRLELGAYGFSSLIQGRPSPRTGGLFDWEWWQLIDVIPAVGRLIRYWDTAGTKQESENHDPDWTVGALLMRMEDGRTVIIDIARFRCSVAERDARILQVCEQDLKRFRHLEIRWWMEHEAGVQGKDRTKAIMRRCQNLGMPMYTEHATGRKESRWEPVQSAAEVGNILLGPGAWRDPFRNEMSELPTGKHDDQADAVAGAYAKLGVGYPAVETFEWRV
jgi:predicted phage terminase large subunit-like protein